MGQLSHPASASAVETTQMVLPAHTNAQGTIFGGIIMQWVDICGAIAANRHCRLPVVTASIDDLHFMAPVRLGHYVILKGMVNYTHRTSLEVGVRVESEDPASGVRSYTSRAYLTFVALDPLTGKPTEVPALTPATADEQRRYDEGKRRREWRLARAQSMKAQSLLV